MKRYALYKSTFYLLTFLLIRQPEMAAETGNTYISEIERQHWNSNDKSVVSDTYVMVRLNKL